MFKITARTILELGSELISSDIIAFYELIKNGFDARTKNGVEIDFNIILRRNSYLLLLEDCEEKDRKGALKVRPSIDFIRDKVMSSLLSDAPSESLKTAREIVGKCSSYEDLIEAINIIYNMSTINIIDTGTGMSQADIEKNFLVIGTPNRKHEVDAAIKQGETKSPYLGEKGIGRLSAMRLGELLNIETAKVSDTHLNLLQIDWRDFSNLGAMLEDISVQPKIGGKKQDKDWSGTTITIGALAEDWSLKRVTRMADYDFARLTNPFEDPKKRPRIVIMWNGERIPITWMNKKLLNHAHASIKGKYEVIDDEPKLTCTLKAIDLGFNHPVEIDVTELLKPDLLSALIGPYGEIPDIALTNLGDFEFEAYWYNRRRLKSIDSIGDLRAVRELQEKWSGILLFRDNFRVFPYGDDEDDWLALDRKALRRSGYALNKTQFIGKVAISRVANPYLVDQTNREGLRETPEQQVLLGIMQYVIQDLLFPFMQNVEKQYKEQKIDLTTTKTEIDTLEKRAQSALKRMRKLPVEESAKADADVAIEDLSQTLLEFSEFAETARARIEQVEKESRQMIDMAGVGLMVEVVAHELARASENTLANLDSLDSNSVPKDVRTKLDALRAEMKSLTKRIRILDPMSVSSRQRAEVFNLKTLLEEVQFAHESQFAREKISLELDMPTDVSVRAVKGMIIQIIENLISNSVYWLSTIKEREFNYQPRIKVTLFDNPPTIIFEDNGPGISPANAEKIFQVFFSLKEKNKRRGLGLYIARECASHNEAKLFVDKQILNISGRLNRFILEFSGKGDF